MSRVGRIFGAPIVSYSGPDDGGGPLNFHHYGTGAGIIGKHLATGWPLDEQEMRTVVSRGLSLVEPLVSSNRIGNSPMVNPVNPTGGDHTGGAHQKTSIRNTIGLVHVKALEVAMHDPRGMTRMLERPYNRAELPGWTMGSGEDPEKIDAKTIVYTTLAKMDGVWAERP